MTVIIVGENRRPFMHSSGPAVGIGPHGSTEHYAGAVVVLKRDGAFGGPGAEDAALAVDPPKRLAGLARIRRVHVIADAFNGAIDAVVECADHSCPGHQPDVGPRCQLGHGSRCPIGPCGVTDGERFCIQSAAHAKVFIRKDHVDAGLGRL